MEQKDYSWMRAAMPGVAKLIAEYRGKWGDKHVTTCIKKGLMGEPGWFFCREGVIAVGTPWGDDPALANFAAQNITSTQALVVLREPEQTDGTR